MKTDTKTIEPVKSVPAVSAIPLCKEPTLIKVMTISSRIVDQLRIEDDHIESSAIFDFSGKEIIGLASSFLILRDTKTGHLSRIRSFKYTEWRVTQLGGDDWKSRAGEAKAKAELAAMPQLFTV